MLVGTFGVVGGVRVRFAVSRKGPMGRGIGFGPSASRRPFDLTRPGGRYAPEPKWARACRLVLVPSGIFAGYKAESIDRATLLLR
jgi:hypothetical protein